MRALNGFFVLLVYFNQVVAESGRSDIPAIITDRPDQSESPFIVPLGHLQVETGFVLSQDRQDDHSKIRTYDVATTLLRYGITDLFEFRLGGSFTIQRLSTPFISRTVSGINGLSIGGKLHLLQGKGLLPRTALIAMVNLPVGPEAFRPDGPSYRVLLASVSPLTEALSLSYNIGGEREGSAALYFFTASFGLSLSERLGAFLEVYGNRSSGVPAELHFDTGLTHLLSPAIQLDSSVGFSFTAESWFFNAGLAFRLPR